MLNQNGEVDDIIPYLDSFKYFSKDNSLKNQFGQIFNQLLSKHKADLTNNLLYIIIMTHNFINVLNKALMIY